MRKLFWEKALCLFLIMSLFVSLVPTTAFAGWEDGIECEFCGGYRFDDWVCDCGPHCSENSDSEDCYLENHCAECLEAVENSERCDTCYICPDCMYNGNGPLHCALCGACDEGGYDVCEDCDVCMNCQVEAGTHCFECGDCLESGSQCPDHPFEMYQENHCENCALKCSGCGDKCFLGELFIDIYCEEHELCVVCATDDGLHCKECYGCYEDELCSECQKCDECGLESGEHCPECDAHGDDWCETGGEGTHCVECASEYLCEQCDVCTSCSGTEFCDECGLCTECCRENAESENCSCGEYCINSANWEEHFCADCGACFDENEQCETCEYCVECCESQSECEDGMCIEDADYDEHFCEECQSCFHTVEACESCQDAGVSLCTECCASLTEDQGCSHEYCTNSWQWDEHYCDLCGKCYGDVDCVHVAEAHVHTYDASGNCTVCRYNKDGKPVITKHPKSVTANPEDATAIYTVEAMGDNLTYQWYYINLSTGKPVAMTEGTAYKGTKTKELSVTVQTGMCSLGKPVQILCVVKNLNGNVTTNTVDFLVAHQYGKYQRDKTHHWYACENCGKKKDQAEHRFNSWTILKQASQTEKGLKRRVCYDCNYADTVTIPALPADHVHDYSAAFVKTDTFHWTKCACGNENKGAMEEHDFGDGWITTIQPTLTSVGQETRTCDTCGYVETKEIEKQGHTHEFYNEEYLENHKDNGNYGYLLNNGYIVNLYSAPYGKKDRTYHYAYCVVDGCDAYERYTHKWYTEWYDLPTKNSDGTYERKCEDCFYTTGLKTSPAGKYRVITKNCTTNIQAAKPGATVKISLYKDYPAGYFVNFNENAPNSCIDVSYTWGNGATGTWKMIEEEYHEPDEKNPKGYWTFTMPDLPTDKNTDWLNFYVEVEVEVLDCTEDNHGDGRGLEWRNQREATCGKTGYTGDYMCKWCNYIVERGHDIPATGEHGELIAEANYIGDCNHAGYTGAKRCSDCDEIIVPREYLGKTHKVTKVPDTYVAATCTSRGQTSQYVCGKCGIVLERSKTIPKLPHEWQFVEEVPATCTATGMKAHYQCSVCKRYSEDKEREFTSNRSLIIPSLGGHKWIEATYDAPKTCSVCKETIGEKLEKPAQELKISGASLTLQDNLTINYMVKSALFNEAGYENPYMTYVLNGKETIVSEYVDAGENYVFSFRNIAPNQMNDMITATLHAKYKGVDCQSASRDYGVITYCSSMLSKSTDAQGEFRTLLVDLLNYGAQSQLYTGYRTESLANATLTSVQKSWATQTDRSWTTVQDIAYKTINNPSVSWKGAGLMLTDRVEIRLSIAADDITNLRVKAELANGTSWFIPATEFKPDEAKPGRYNVDFNGLNSGQMSEPVYFTVYKGGTVVSNTVRYSVESYAYAQANKAAPDTSLLALLKVMMKYGDAAYNYVN